MPIDNSIAPFCEEHEEAVEKKYVPPGVSKASGKPYQGFWVCNVCRPLRKAPTRLLGGKNGYSSSDYKVLSDKIDELEALGKKLIEKVNKLLDLDNDTEADENNQKSPF